MQPVVAIDAEVAGGGGRVARTVAEEASQSVAPAGAGAGGVAAASPRSVPSSM